MRGWCGSPRGPPLRHPLQPLVPEALQASHVEGGGRWGRGDFTCVLQWVTGHLGEHDAAMGRFLAARRRMQAQAWRGG